MKKIACFTITLFWVVLGHAQSLLLYQTKCDSRINPIGMDTPNPKFSWKIRVSDTSRQVVQTAYEIKVALTPEGLSGNAQDFVWSSGRVYSSQSLHIPYNGGSLSSFTRYYWRVRVWDNKGRVSPWSNIQHWETGLLNEHDWKGEWITSKLNGEIEGPAVMFRREFAIKEKIKAARLYVSAHGVYEIEINGERVGDEFFNPGWTSYLKRLQYQVYDVTDHLRQGENAIGALVGDGWFKGNLSKYRNLYGKEEALLVFLRIEYHDGQLTEISSDEQWKASIDGPIRMSDFYNGEVYDASKASVGWSMPGFNEQGWSPVFIDSTIGKSKLISVSSPPVRITEKVSPKAQWSIDSQKRIIDFGQNLAGFVSFRLNSKAGDTLKIRHAEVLDHTGGLYRENLRNAKQDIVYVTKAGRQEYRPHFTFQGFRYIEMESTGVFPDIEELTANVLHSDLENTGQFFTSDTLLNQLQSNIQWSQRGNFIDVPTDCPQRDERWGWTGDAQVFFETAGFNMDVGTFFRKWLMDLEADQLENGKVPSLVPDFWPIEWGGSAGWGDASTVIPWQHFGIYGDTSILRQQYQSMKKWIAYIAANSENDLWTKGWHFGDWLFYTPADDRDGLAAITDKYLIAQAYYIHSLAIMVNAATVLENCDDADHYIGELKKKKEAFVKEFVTPSGRIVSGTQTAYVLALAFNVLPDSLRNQAIQRLVDNTNRYGHLTTGFLGTPYLLKVLSENGHSELAYKLLKREDYPSWLYPVKKGATTIWERWDGIKSDGSFQNPGMNSFNHYAYGAVGNWMYENIGGIRKQEGKAGFKHFLISPNPGGNIAFATAVFESVYGRVMSAWKIEGEMMSVTVEIPVNTSADVVLPFMGRSTLREGNNLVSGNESILKLGSGSYNFNYKIEKQ